jgi:hypothetical protein
LQKARYTGTPGAIFNVGTKSFPFGVWVECPDAVLDTIRKQGLDAVGVFEFNPPLEPIEQITEVEEKPRRGRRRTSKKEADE